MNGKNCNLEHSKISQKKKRHQVTAKSLHLYVLALRTYWNDILV